MTGFTEELTKELQAARERKGFSQRELGKRAGIPQSHISKIEKGIVDLRVSSLVELARALDLELTLVPRKSVPAVRTIARSTAAASPTYSHKALKSLKRLQETMNKIPSNHPGLREVERIQEQISMLMRFPNLDRHLDGIREVYKALRTIREKPGYMEAIRKANSTLGNIRNSLMHFEPGNELPVHAYRLEDNY